MKQSLGRVVTVAFINLGCAKNLVDAEVMGQVLQSSDYRVIDDPQAADVVIVNTCGFIEEAKRESIEEIFSVIGSQESAAGGENRALVVSGCLAQRYGKQLKEEIPEIDGILGVNDLHRVDEVVSSALEGVCRLYCCSPGAVIDASRRRRQTPGHYGYVKIAAGCSRRCAFCAIPLIRGPYRCKDPGMVHREVESLTNTGAREVILIAQDTAGYRLSAPRGLTDLLRGLALRFPDTWFRVLYLHPSSVKWPLIQLIGEADNICSYLDVPLQHASRRVLRRMGRTEDPDRVRRLLILARERYPAMSLRATFLVGHPGEKQKDFSQLLELLRQLRPDHTAVFSFSPEENTAAFEMNGRVGQDTARQRRQTLLEDARRISRQVKQRFVGRVLPVIVDRESQEGMLSRHQGQTPGVDGYTLLPGDSGDAVRPGAIVRAEITGADEVDLWGRVVNDEQTGK